MSDAEENCIVNDNVTHVELTPRVAERVATSQVIVLCMGLDEHVELERLDRTSILLPNIQNLYIAAILDHLATLNSTCKVVLVLSSGGCVDVTQWFEHAKVDSIVWLGYGGMFTGTAIANVLFGAVAPFAKLSQTWYREAFLSEMGMKDMRMRPNMSSGAVGRGYRYYTGESVLFPFGYGLTLTSFTCRWLSDEAVVDSRDSIVVQISNTGMVDSGCVVFLFWVPNNQTFVTSLQKRLVGFDNIHLLERNQSKDVRIELYSQFYSSQELAARDGSFELGGDCKQ